MLLNLMRDEDQALVLFIAENVAVRLSRPNSVEGLRSRRARIELPVPELQVMVNEYSKTRPVHFGLRKRNT